MDNNENSSPSIRLRYNKGDLIIKEGDYGISIYKIVKGKVGIFNESGEREISLATLGRGEVIGEMTFLSRITDRRAASVRALEDTELEVWNPGSLSREYEQMPPIIKYIADQAMSRLVRMNKLIINLHAEKKEEEERRKKGEPEPPDTRRLYYRKKVDLPCSYRSVDSSPEASLEGRVKDLSFCGVGLEVKAKSGLKFSHEPGNELYINTVLPNGKEVDVIAKIVLNKKGSLPGSFFIGMEITEMNEDSKKALGFFLMP